MLVVTSWSLVHVRRAAKMLSCLTCMFPGRCLLVSPPAVNKRPFHGLLSTVFYTFLCFSLVIWLFNMAPKPSADVLSRVPKGTKAGVCFMETSMGFSRQCFFSLSVILNNFIITSLDV